MIALTIVALIASLIGLALQVKDSFHDSKIWRDRVVCLIYGATIGILVSLGTKVNISFGEELFFVHLATYTIIFFLLIILVFSVLGLLFADEDGKQVNILIICGLCLVFLVSIYFTQVKPEGSIFEFEGKSLTFQEAMLLANYHSEKSDFTREWHFLSLARNTLDSRDPRAEEIFERMYPSFKAEDGKEVEQGDGSDVNR